VPELLQAVEVLSAPVTSQDVFSGFIEGHRASTKDASLTGCERPYDFRQAVGERSRSWTDFIGDMWHSEHLQEG